MYEQKFINERLMFRTFPDGKWKPMKTSWGKAANVLFALTDDERMSVFELFCTNCGCTDPRCDCWNDE